MGTKKVGLSPAGARKPKILYHICTSSIILFKRKINLINSSNLPMNIHKLYTIFMIRLGFKAIASSFWVILAVLKITP